MNKFANIQALVAVIESGSFSKAAERLGTGKSIVSRRVSQLEASLGVQLLQRTTRAQSLTGPGREFYARAVRILADLEDAEQSIVDESSALRGPIRIAAPLSFGLQHLAAALNKFLQNHPAISLDLDLNDREVNLVEDGFDMAVRIGELRDSGLLVRSLGTARFATCASPDYLERHGTPTHPDDLKNHVGLHYSNLSPQKAWCFCGSDNREFSAIPQIGLRANNGNVLCHAAVGGHGIVSSPTFIVADDIANGRLVSVLQDYHRTPVGIHALYPPGRMLPRRISVLTDFLAEQFGTLPYWDRQIGITPD